MNNKTLNRMMNLFYLMGCLVFVLTAQAAGNQPYHFKLTKGKGTLVCDAYLKRLNATEFDEPPFCGIPENDSVEGFTLLKRMPLALDDIHDLNPIVAHFLRSANNKSLDWTDMNLQQKIVVDAIKSRVRVGNTIMEKDENTQKSSGKSLLQIQFDGGIAKIWRYDPPIDIDNDGVPDNVEVWHGAALANGVEGRQCGGEDFSGNGLMRQPQVVFVVTGNDDRLDVAKTEKIFGHPVGGYPLYDKRIKRWEMSEDFRPVGENISIFKFQDSYYFETLFSSWGDFEGKRRKDKNIGNTLAVFQHKDNKTKQVCEYLMTEKTQSVRGKK